MKKNKFKVGDKVKFIEHLKFKNATTLMPSRYQKKVSGVITEVENEFCWVRATEYRKEIFFQLKFSQLELDLPQSIQYILEN